MRGNKHRRRLTKKQSRRNFRKGTKVKGANRRRPSRGGIRF